MRLIDTIVVHCSDTEEGTVESIRRYHIEVKGWHDIGYHYVIYRDGGIHEGRPVEEVGAHVEGANQTSIGICLIGKDHFEQCQFDALKRLILTLQNTFSRINSVKNHYEFPSAIAQGKTCPNFNVHEVLGV